MNQAFADLSRDGCLRPAGWLDRRPAGCLSHVKGLTLLELLLVLVLIAVVCSLTIPGMVGLAGRNELTSGAEQIRTAIVQARNNAMRTGQTRLLLYGPGAGRYAEVAEPLEPTDAVEWAVVQTFLRQADTSLGGQAEPPQLPPAGLRTGRVACLPRDVVFLDASRLVNSAAPLTGLVTNPSASTAAETSTVLEFPYLRFAPDGSSQDHLLVLSNLEGDQIPIVVRGLTGLSEVGALASPDRPYLTEGLSR